jgi:hypothetical protein
MIRLEDLIGKKVLLALEKSTEAGYDVILHGVEYGGIWVESKELEKRIGHRKAAAIRAKPSTKPVFFYPYAQISFLIAYSTDL